MSCASQQKRDPLASQPLRNVAAVDDEQLELSYVSAVANAEAAQGEMVDEPSRRTDRDDNADPHADGDSRIVARPRRE